MYRPPQGCRAVANAVPVTNGLNRIPSIQYDHWCLHVIVESFEVCGSFRSVFSGKFNAMNNSRNVSFGEFRDRLLVNGCRGNDANLSLNIVLCIVLRKIEHGIKNYFLNCPVPTHCLRLNSLQTSRYDELSNNKKPHVYFSLYRISRECKTTLFPNRVQHTFKNILKTRFHNRCNSKMLKITLESVHITKSDESIV